MTAGTVQGVAGGSPWGASRVLSRVSALADGGASWGLMGCFGLRDVYNSISPSYIPSGRGVQGWLVVVRRPLLVEETDRGPFLRINLFQHTRRGQGITGGRLGDIFFKWQFQDLFLVRII